MRLATQTSISADCFGFKKSIELIKDAGFDSVDFSMFCMSLDDACVLNSDNWREAAKDIKKFADSLGIPFSQAHAPFYFSIDDGEEVFLKNVREKVSRAIEIAGILEIPVIIAHPMQFRPFYKKKNQKYFREFNKEYYAQYLPLCEKNGVKIACENLWKTKGKGKRKHIIDGACADPAGFSELIDSVGSEYFTGCLDIGHCALTGRNAADFIRAAGNRISALHVHDNNGVEDLHMPPGYGNTNWDEVCRALAEINYSGDFTLEADEFLVPYRGDPERVLLAMKIMERTGRKLIEKIENYKQKKSR